MPVYEYTCEECGAFDHRRSVADRALAVACPSCRATARRVFTAPGIGSRSGPTAGAGAADRDRIDRARTGEPVRGPAPAGRRLPGAHGH